MYRAILCDDDEIIARGMSMCIPWEELGIEFCGYRNNGLEGKRLFDEVKPDIVMTDICMPLMDGLQLTEYAKSVNPDVRVIIFSGYGDFKYAQKAIHVGAMDYLLKPINETELRALLRRAVEELNRVREHSIYERDREQRNMTDLLRTLMFDGPAAAKLRGSAAILDELKSDCVMAFIANIDSYNQLHYRMTNEEILNVNTNFASCFEKQLSEFIILDRNYGELIMAAVAGITITAYTTSGNPLVGESYTQRSITTAVVGGALLAGGKNSIIGCLASVLIMGIINNLLNLLRITAYYQYVLQGVILIAALALSAIRSNK